ncbi:MAG: PASTA domain-containing protein [Thermoanaerobaculales bacterium]|jgi:serine/threonine-protein kinase|nr:PASTA domain-containing protein [Thermoanaerobaculales bacterium]
MAARLLALAVFLPVSGVVFWFALVHTVHQGATTVPDLTGTTVEDARAAVHDLGMELAVEEPGVFSASVPIGVVAVQRPHAGYQVKTGARLTVRLSLGNERVTLPLARGESLQSALRSLEQLGLTAGARLELDGHGGPDQVVATRPSAGTLAPPGTRVDLLINKTPRAELWVMPSLLSRDVEVIRRFCGRHGLRLGQIHEVVYPGIAAGTVLRQYPTAGAPLSRTDIISVWVSR